MLFTNQEQMKQYKINPGRGPTESQIQLYSFWAGKLTYSCPSLAETSICLNYSVCAALKLNSKKRLASKRKERTGSQLLFIRQEKTAKSRSTECACEVLQIQPRPRAPFGLGAGAGLGLIITLSSPNSFWEEHLLWAGKLATVTINQDDMRQLLLLSESFNVWHYFVWYNHSWCS